MAAAIVAAFISKPCVASTDVTVKVDSDFKDPAGLTHVLVSITNTSRDVLVDLYVECVFGDGRGGALAVDRGYVREPLIPRVRRVVEVVSNLHGAAAKEAECKAYGRPDAGRSDSPQEEAQPLDQGGGVSI